MFIVRLGGERLANIWHQNWFMASAIFIEYGMCFVSVHFFGVDLVVPAYDSHVERVVY